MQNETMSSQRLPIRPRPNHGPNGKPPESSADAQGTGSVIGADITITGDIHASEDLVIEGKVDGGVTCGTLVIGESGRVNGDIHTDRLQLSGQVEGSISTSDLAVENTARVQGDIEYSRLRVASGAIIIGQLTRRDGEDNRATQLHGETDRVHPAAVFEDRSFSEINGATRSSAAT